MQQHTDDRAPLWIQINDQFWPQNRNYIIGELVLVSLLALGSFYLLLKTFVRSSRRAEFKHARLLLMIAAPILTVASILDLVLEAFTITVVDHIKSSAPAEYYPRGLTAIFHTLLVGGLLKCFARVSIVTLIPSVSLGLASAAGATSSLLTKMRLAGYIVASFLALLCTTNFIMAEVLANGKVYWKSTPSFSRHLNHITDAQMYLFFIAFTALIPVAAFGRHLAGPAFRKAGTLILVASVCAFVAALLALIYNVIAHKVWHYIPIWVTSILYRIFHDALDLVALVLLATVVGSSYPGGDIGKEGA